MNQISQHLLICSGHSTDHQIVFFKSDTYPEVYMHVHLCPKPFWQRVKHAIKYVFGYKSKYGAWDEFVLDHTHAEALSEIAEHLVDENLHSISFH